MNMDISTSDYEFEETKDNADEEDPFPNDERYKAVKDFFEKEILLFSKWQYFKLCVENGIDTMKKLKDIKKEKLIKIGIDSDDADTMVIKTKMIHL